MLKRCLKILLKIWLLLVLLLFVFLLFERFRGQISLASFKRQLAAKGETLDVRMLILQSVADEDNGAPGVLQLKDSLHDGTVLTLHTPPKMKLVAPGKTMVGFREDGWIDEKVTYTWDEVAQDLATNKPVLEEFRALLAKPVFDFKLDHSKGFMMGLKHLSSAKSFCQWLGPAFQISLRNGENQAALDDLLAALAIPRILENDHIAISELVREAVSSINIGTTWEALQADVWTDEQLAMIQAAWDKNTFATNMTHAFEVERADADAEFGRFRKSNEETYAAMFPDWPSFFDTGDGSGSPHWWHKEFVRRQIYCRVWRFAWLYQDERFYLAGMDRLIHDHRTGAEKAAHPVQSIWLDLPIAKTLHQNFYDDWRYGMSAESLASLSMAAVRAARAETDRSFVLCAIGLKRYLLRHGKPASSLDDLVPEFLPAVPMDYMDGKPMKYRLNVDGTSVLYSVGDDGYDDDGDASPVNPKQSYRSIWRGKDVVWPSPATPEEIAAWRKQSAKD